MKVKILSPSFTVSRIGITDMTFITPVFHPQFRARDRTLEKDFKKMKLKEPGRRTLTAKSEFMAAGEACEALF